MSLLFLLIFFLSVVLSIYLLDQHNNHLRQQNRKRSQPLPPIGNLETDLSKTNDNINRKTSDGQKQTTAPQKISATWRQSVSEMRKKKQTEAALKLCKSKFPLYTAYREATLVLRSMLKNEGLSRAEIKKTLSQLYKTAAIAELIYSKKSAVGKSLPDQLKTADIKLFDKIPLDYNKLGYLKLPLLTKHDTKVLVSHWGEPDKHDSPSNLYEKHLLKLIS